MRNLSKTSNNFCSGNFLVIVYKYSIRNQLSLVSLDDNPWITQQMKVCFGTKNNTFGTFYINQEGALYSLKLVHRSGYVSCVGSGKLPYAKSNWFCSKTNPVDKACIGVMITDQWNTRIFPKDVGSISKDFYLLPGYHCMSPSVAFVDFSTPMYATLGLELRVWYGEDLHDSSEVDNSGTACVDVYAKFS